jgi:hypothetical protein
VVDLLVREVHARPLPLVGVAAALEVVPGAQRGGGRGGGVGGRFRGAILNRGCKRFKAADERGGKEGA